MHALEQLEDRRFEVPIRVPRWATARNATSDGSSGTVSSTQSGRSVAGDVVDDEAVLGMVLDGCGQPSGIGVGAGGFPRGIRRQRVTPDPAAVVYQQLRGSAEEGAVGHGEQEDGARGRVCGGRRRTADTGRGPLSPVVTLRESTTFSRGESGWPICSRTRASTRSLYVVLEAGWSVR